MSTAIAEHFPFPHWNHFHVEKTVPPIRQRLANNLRHLLKDEERSGNTIAEAGRIDGKTFNNLLHARFDPRLTIVEKAARGFGLSAWQLIAADLTGDPPADKDVLRLLELFARANPAAREAILQVAAAVTAKR